MRITALTVYKIALPLHKPYSLSGGRLRFDELGATLVAIETDAGFTGWGEGCPWGSTYLPGFGKGAMAGIEEIAPSVLDECMHTIGDAPDAPGLGVAITAMG